MNRMLWSFWNNGPAPEEVAKIEFAILYAGKR
jgi:hypothetical protein